jgi:hypothetical protein
MSRCYCCNNILTTQESVRKFRDSGTFTEMCNTCLGTITEIGGESTATIEGEATDEDLFDDEGNPRED